MMMNKLTPKIELSLIIVSFYNLIIFIINGLWLGFNKWGLLTLIPQTLFLMVLVLKVKRIWFNKSSYKYLLTVSILWMSCVLINGKEWIFPSEPTEWPYWYGLMQTNGFPIIDMKLKTPIPLFGFFHSPKGNVWVDGSYFDGGVTFSWLFFNILSVILLATLFKSLLSKVVIADSNLYKAYCSNCGVKLESTFAFCNKCGLKLN